MTRELRVPLKALRPLMFYHVHVQSKPLLRGFPCCKSLLAVGPLQTPGSMLTLQGIPCEAQLANDVAGNVTFNPLSLFGVALSCFQQVVELFRVKLLYQGREVVSGESYKWRLLASVI